MKRILYIILLVSLLFAFAIPSFAQEESVNVEDVADAISASEEQLLVQCLSGLAQRTGYTFHLYVYEGRRQSFSTSRYFDRHAVSDRDDLFLVVLTREGGVWYYDLYTYGACDTALSDGELGRLLDAPEVYDAIKGGAVYEGVYALFTQSESLLTNSEQKGSVPFRTRLGRAFVVAMAVALVSSLAIVLYYKRKKRGASYPLKEFTDLKLTLSNDVYVGSSVTRRYAPRSSSSSGGGGSRSGGGGHRGGR